jgi:branched-chain amino acid transport system substrate-binding protein
LFCYFIIWKKEGFMMKKTIYFLIMMLICFIFGQTGGVSADTKTIKLGHLSAFSGGASLYGADAKRAIIMAVEEINGKGGIEVAGQRYLVDVVHLDHKYKAAAAVASYRRLVDFDGIHFIHNMGTVTAKAIMPYNEEDKVLLDIISPTESITLTGNKLLLDQVVRPSGYDPPVVTEAIKRGLRRLCIIADDSTLGKDHTAVITKYWEKLGGKVVATEFVKALKEVDFMPVLTKLKGHKPDAMYIIAQEEPGIRITKQAREAGIDAKLLYVEHFKKKTADSVGLDKLEGTLFVGSYSTLSSLPVPGTPEDVLAYREKYLKRWPDKYLSATGCYGYNYVYYTLKAMQLAGTTTDVYKVRAAASQAIKEDPTLKYGGFTKGGRAYGMPRFVMAIDKGKVHVVSSPLYPEDMAAEGEK